jgi:hypothetical protein
VVQFEFQGAEFGIKNAKRNGACRLFEVVVQFEKSVARNVP